MKASLIIFGVIFLVIGGLLYFMPLQKISANTTTSDGGNTDTRTSSAILNVPIEWAYASGIIGFVLLVLGLVIPSSIRRNSSKDNSFDTVVESKENIEVGEGNKRKIIRERTEQHKSRKEDN